MNNILALAEFFGSWLFYTSIKASILIIMVLIVRWLFGNRVSPAWKHTLWLLLFVQMLLPWSPKSKFSIENLWKYKKDNVVKEESGRIGAYDIKPKGNVASITDKQMAPAVAQKINTMQWGKILVFSIWGLVTMSLAGLILYRNHRTTSMLKQRRLLTEGVFLDILEDCKEKLNIHFPVGLVSVPGGESPMIVGFIRPIMVIPERILREFSHKEIRHIMLHELSHIKRWDIALNWLTAGLQVVHWFNPFVWIAFHVMRSDREQACDMMAVKCMGYQEKVPYGETVIKLLEGFNQSRFLPETAGIMEGKEQMKKRIKMIGQLGRKFKYSRLLCAIAMVLLGAATLTGADKNNKKSLKTASVKKENLIQKKLDSINIKHAEFAHESIVKVVEKLNKLSKESDPEKKGVNIVLKLDEEQLKNTVTLLVDDISLGELIRNVCIAADLKYRITDVEIIFVKNEKKSKENPLVKKLDSIIIKHVEFMNASIQKVVEELNKLAKESDPEKKGVKFVLQLDNEQLKNTVTLLVDDISLGELIKNICLAADWKYKISDDKVIFAENQKDIMDQKIQEK